ncbi:fibrobacter succinogenes major paralogous domain-containing protein [Fibrobacter sp. UWB10]|uniref:fibrobacter succinogenes major paralogous domain-containing protein n=1 Tax=Fibrobacter sp. UWB10 TaxID=1896201 RepID=UPI002402F104|nr:fibrobacter succinogenes major paralogous domain-containing protein [Fibrobacter sp. UWB10]SMP45817.1 major paralogous domain-containing protein [Fibrobacter sp. UWB10]
MKKILDLSSWRTALGNLLPSAHGHQGGSRKAAIGFMLIVAFAVVGCDDSSSASAGPNDEPAVESSSAAEHSSSSSSAQKNSSSSEKAKSSSSKEENVAEESSSSVKSESSPSVEKTLSSSSSTDVLSSSSETVVKSCSSEGVLSSSSQIDWKWDLPKEAYLNPEIEYDSITDARDGKVYKTVKIGDQIWMAENLNFDPGQGGSGENKYDWSWCFLNDAKNCDVIGRFYTWAAAIDSVKLANDVDNPQDCGYDKTCTLPDTVYGVCPPGWHLPDSTEWEVLFLTVGGQSVAGKVLKSQVGWKDNGYNNGNGSDAVGFSALPAGNGQVGGKFYRYGGNALFWSAFEIDSTYAGDVNLNYLDEYAGVAGHNKINAMSVRCVKD